MPIIILKPANTPEGSWIIHDPPNPPRPATFGASKEINSDYAGNGTKVVLQAMVGGKLKNAIKLEITIDGQAERVSMAGTGTGLQWWLGDSVLSSKAGVPDLPAEFNGGIDDIRYWTGTINGNTTVEGKAGKD